MKKACSSLPPQFLYTQRAKSVVSSAIEADSSFAMAYLEINPLNDHIGYKASIHEKTLILKHLSPGFCTDASSSSEEEEASSGNVFRLSHKTVARDFFLSVW